jgi:hypothetical protein
LLRSLPTQRAWAIGAASRELAAWLADERDLFDAQRALLRAEAGGQRSLSEVLRLLALSDSDGESLL